MGQRDVSYSVLYRLWLYAAWKILPATETVISITMVGGWKWSAVAFPGVLKHLVKFGVESGGVSSASRPKLKL